jgi:hypothetical protein
MQHQRERGEATKKTCASAARPTRLGCLQAGFFVVRCAGIQLEVLIMHVKPFAFGLATALIGCIGALSACGSDESSSKGGTGGASGSSGTSGSGGSAGTGGGSSGSGGSAGTGGVASITCGANTCEPVSISGFAVPGCCAPGDKCGIDSSGFMDGGPSCTELNQPGNADQSCTDALRPEGGTGDGGPGGFQVNGCCRPDGKCGILFDQPIPLGCIDISQYVSDGGTVPTCTPE